MDREKIVKPKKAKVNTKKKVVKTIGIENGTFSVNGKQILSNINVQFKVGAFNLFKGENGAGKSTVAKILSGVEELDQGTLDNELLKDTYLVLQNPDEQILNYSVMDELQSGIPYKERKMYEWEVLHYAQLFKIEDVLQKEVRDLSQGEKQIINLITILLKNPKVLILDESLSIIYGPTKEIILDELNRKVKEDEMTIICITHDEDIKARKTNIIEITK